MAALARGIGVALLFVAWVGAAWVMSGTAVRAQDKKTVWDKVYTAEQASKGKVEYDNHCSGCHVKDLSGRDGGGEGPEPALRHLRRQTCAGVAHRDPHRIVRMPGANLDSPISRVRVLDRVDRVRDQVVQHRVDLHTIDE